MAGRQVGWALLAFLLAALEARPVAATPPTHCTFSVTLSLSPGLSVVPTSGSFTSGGETGSFECDGPVRGATPTGPGTLGVEGRYGTEDPDTCFDGEGEATFSLTFPTASGPAKRRNVLTLRYGLLSPGGPGGSFSGKGFSGEGEVQPEEGNCFTEPVTRVSVRGRGTITEQ